jgi:hypothetical protein
MSRVCSGYHPRIFAMKCAQDEHRRVKEAIAEAQIKKIRNRDAFDDVFDQLKAVDPDWEAFYDDDDNVPVEIYWDDRALPVIERMKKRLEDVKGNLTPA